MKYKILLLLTLASLWSCKKDSTEEPASTPPLTEQTIVGTVRDYVSRSGVNPVFVADAEVQLIRAEEKTGFGSSFTLVNPDTLFSTSDANGAFQFTVPVDSKKIFTVRASKPGYVFIDPFDAQTLPEKDTVEAYVVYLDIASIVNITFHDTMLNSLNDSLQFRVTYASNPVVFGASASKDYYHKGMISNNQTLSFSDTISGTTFAYAEVMWAVFDSLWDKAYGDPTYLVNQFGVTTIDIVF